MALILGTTKQTIYKYETGIVSNIPVLRLKALADALGVDVADIVETDGIKRRGIPLLGEIACGEPIFSSETYGTFLVADGIEADFCLRASGDSMVGARIFDGDIVFIRSMSSVENGEIAAVSIDDEATLKRVYFYPEKNLLRLMPENPRFAPIEIMGEELSSVRILGKAVAFQSYL